MNNTSQEFGIFIDNIRNSRNMSKDDFVDGILSKRQFSRYLKGDSTITIENIIKLIEKLELEFFFVYNRFLQSSNIEHNIIGSIYNHIMSLEFKEASELVKKYESHIFKSLYYKKLFNLFSIISNQKLLKISREMAINYCEEIIDYSGCMNSKDINYLELISLLYISQIVKDEDRKDKILSKLFDVLKFHKISDFDKNNPKMAMVYSSFARLLGAQEEFEKVIYLTKKGINLCAIHNSTNSLAHLYYYCALGYKGQNKLPEALECVKKAFFTLELEGKPLKYNAFVQLFESHFKLDFSEFKTW